MDLSTLRITTVAGSGEQGLRDGDALDARFDEPAGLTFRDGIGLRRRDTNNHAIRKFDVESATVEIVNLKGI